MHKSFIAANKALKVNFNAENNANFKYLQYYKSDRKGLQQ